MLTTGENCFVWFGPSPRLAISDPELLKEIMSRPDVFHKTHPGPIVENVAGGLMLLEDEKWAKHRRIINPVFKIWRSSRSFLYINYDHACISILTNSMCLIIELMFCVQSMVSAIRLCCSNMVEKWEALFSSTDTSKEIDVYPAM